MWRGVGFIRQSKLMVVRFVRLRGLPVEIAKGVALGIFIGMTPTFGFQMAIALFFAYLLKENRLAAILAAVDDDTGANRNRAGLGLGIGRVDAFPAVIKGGEIGRGKRDFDHQTIVLAI